MPNTITKPSSSQTDEKEMSFIEHLDEMRIHLIRIAIAVCVCAVFVFFATQSIFEHIIFGPLKENFLTYQLMCQLSHYINLGDQMCYAPVNVNLVTFEMGEAFLLHIKTCLFGGLVISFPYVLWEFWKFYFYLEFYLATSS